MDSSHQRGSCMQVFETCKTEDQGSKGEGPQSGSFDTCFNALMAQSFCTRLEDKTPLPSMALGEPVEEMEVKAWYRIHELTQLAVRTELGREKEGDEGGMRQKRVFNIMAHALFWGRRTKRWEQEDMLCRVPTPSGRNMHQVEFLRRWTLATESCKPWSVIENEGLRALMLLCLWFERLVFQSHWSERILRPWLAQEIETKWPYVPVTEEDSSFSLFAFSKSSLLSVIYDERVHLAAAVSVVAHILRGFCWRDPEWQHQLLLQLCKRHIERKCHEFLLPPSFVMLVRPWLNFLPGNAQFAVWLSFSRYFLSENQAKEALPYLLAMPSFALSLPLISEMLPKTLSIFEGITDAAWGSAVEISSTPGVYVMKEFPHEGVQVDGHSRASLFTTLIGKARTERALGRRVAAAESLGMAATLLPPEFVSRLPVCNPKIDADTLSSLPDACPDLSPESLPRSFPVEDLVDFFEAKSEMWEELGTAKALRMAEGYLSIAAKISMAAVKANIATEERFEKDRRLVWLLDVLLLMEKGEYEAARDKLEPLVVAMRTESDGEGRLFRTRPVEPWEWSDRFELFVILVDLQMTKSLRGLGLPTRLTFSTVPEQLLSTLIVAIATAPADRYADQKIQARFHQAGEDPMNRRFELFEFLVWDVVGHFVSHLLSSPEEDPMSEKLTDLLSFETVSFPDGVAGIAQKSDTPEVAQWKFLHPLNATVFHWLTPAVVRLFEEKDSEDDLKSFLEKVRVKIELEEEGKEQLLEVLKEERIEAWEGIKEALKERMGSGKQNTSLHELPPNFKENHKPVENPLTEIPLAAMKMSNLFSDMSPASILCDTPCAVNLNTDRFVSDGPRRIVTRATIDAFGTVAPTDAMRVIATPLLDVAGSG